MASFSGAPMLPAICSCTSVGFVIMTMTPSTSSKSVVSACASTKASNASMVTGSGRRSAVVIGSSYWSRLAAPNAHVIGRG